MTRDLLMAALFGVLALLAFALGQPHAGELLIAAAANPAVRAALPAKRCARCATPTKERGPR